MSRTETRAISDKDQQMFKVWRDTLKLTGKTLEQTLAEELAEYFGTTVDYVIEFWYYSTERLKQEWEAQNPQSEEEVIEFYNKNTTYIYELSFWHTLHMNLGLIENVRSLELATSRSGRTYLDFGGGTGSNIILFGKHGFQCTLADVSSTILDFAKWRLKKRNIKCEIIDLKEQGLPDNFYDFVTAVEVLEHSANPLQVMETIVKATRQKGLITAWVPFFEDDLRPMHLATKMEIVSTFIDLGLKEISCDDQMMIRVYEKR
jgi:ubiquinone/menaquinone biosynthesis C-methylase UbiE